MSAVVLVVEDDDDAREALAELLQAEGYAVAQAVNGLAALEWLRANPAPRVILLDLMMPVMSGPEFRDRQLREAALAAIPVIIVSAIDGTVAEQLGVADHFLKPLDPGKLLAAVGKYC